MNILSKIDKYLDEDKSFALVTVVESRGSCPREIGAKMIVFSDGEIEGTVGGGKVEYSAIKDALYFIEHKASGLKEHFLDKKHGSLCGGSMKVFIETFNPGKKLIIFGAGHIGIALYKLASIFNFKISVIDQRKEFAKKGNFPNAEVFCCKPQNITKKIKIDKNTFIVVVTHGHEHDYVILQKLIKTPAKYIGMIGSRAKIKEVFNKLTKDGFTKKELQNISAPIGLNLGDDSPETIALGILAQIISVANGVKNNLKFKKMI